MIRNVIVLTALLSSAITHAQSPVDAVPLSGVGINVTSPKVKEQCGLSISTPVLESISGQTIGFGCTGSFENGERAVMEMDFQYDPNFDTRGGDNISFVVEKIGLNKKIAAGGDSVFQLKPDDKVPTLASDSAYKKSNCGNPATKTHVMPIQGANWRGWIAEETFAKARGSCKSAKEYTSSYRCIHVMVGNTSMNAQLDGVCLLRRRELTLKHGFSYDLFMDMLRTLRFTDE